MELTEKQKRRLGRRSKTAIFDLMDNVAGELFNKDWTFLTVKEQRLTSDGTVFLLKTMVRQYGLSVKS